MPDNKQTALTREEEISDLRQVMRILDEPKSKYYQEKIKALVLRTCKSLEATPAPVSSSGEMDRMLQFKVDATFEAVKRFPENLGSASKIAVDQWMEAMQWVWDNYLKDLRQPPAEGMSIEPIMDWATERKRHEQKQENNLREQRDLVIKDKDRFNELWSDIMYRMGKQDAYSAMQVKLTELKYESPAPTTLR